VKADQSRDRRRRRRGETEWTGQAGAEVATAARRQPKIRVFSADRNP
jgi:hypothetical protein